MVSRMFNKNLPMSSAEEPEELYIKLAELVELMVDWKPYIYKESAIRNLSYAISIRKNVISIEKNDIQISIDEAQMKMWEYQYKDARDILQSIINKKTGVTIAKYKAYELLATVNILLDNYSDAEENLVFCLDLSKQLGYSDNYNYPVRVQLGHLYNLRNRVNESEEYNKQLLFELLDIYGNNKKDILADVYYNIGDVYFRKGDCESARKYLNKAIETYKEENFFRSRKYNYIGQARCYEKLADISIKEGAISEAIKSLKESLKWFGEMLGPEHPETKSCQEKIYLYE